MELTVKRITKVQSDLIDVLTQIEAEAFGDGGLNRWTFPVIMRHGALFIVECDSDVCGVADIIKVWDDPDTAFVINFVVREGRRGKGLGSTFLGEILQNLKNEGVKRVQLTVDPVNERAIRLYKKFGFSLIAELDGEYGPIEDRLLFELELEG